MIMPLTLRAVATYLATGGRGPVSKYPSFLSPYRAIPYLYLDVSVAGSLPQALALLVAFKLQVGLAAL